TAETSGCYVEHYLFLNPVRACPFELEVFFFSSRRRHTRCLSDWSSDVCSSDLIERADADFVRAETGFAIGGVAPIGHAKPIVTLIDEDLMQWDAIWAAGGHPNTVFRLTPADLVTLTAGRVVAVK